MRVISIKPETSISRRTYSETIECRIRHIKQAERPRKFLRKLIQALINRATNKFKGLNELKKCKRLPIVKYPFLP